MAQHYCRNPGIIYFNHSFGDPHRTKHCLREQGCATIRAVVKQTNQLIDQLAPVLNAPFVDNFVSASASIRTMAKFHEDKGYVFAGSKENAAATPTFFVGRGRAWKGHGRAIPIKNGQFSDHFPDGQAIHVYRIDL
jgi:hypothetical protein